MKIYFGDTQLGDATRKMTTSGFSVELAPVVQIGQPIRAAGARPFARGNRLYTVRFATQFVFGSVSLAEDYISRQAAELPNSAQLRWTTSPPGGLSTWYLWKAKLAGYQVPPYLGCAVTIQFQFIGSHLSATADPNPDPEE